MASGWIRPTSRAIQLAGADQDGKQLNACGYQSFEPSTVPSGATITYQTAYTMKRHGPLPPDLEADIMWAIATMILMFIYYYDLFGREVKDED